MAIDIRQYVEDRLRQAPAPTYEYPLAYGTLGADEILAALNCLCNQRTTMWEATEAFEKDFAAYIGTSDAVMVNSGSSADLVMMLAARESGLLSPGDEILIPAVTWPTQVWAAVEAGFKVTMVDVEPETLNTSPEILEAAIKPKTKAIFLVHLMGNPCQMDAIADIAKRHGLRIFEDCCEALGAEFNARKIGGFSTASAFSFFASHHISTMEGGMIASSNEDFADQCRMLRAHGWTRDLKHDHNSYECDDRRYHFLGEGFNFRPTELSAAIGRTQLETLPARNEQRQENALTVKHGVRYQSQKLEPLRVTSEKAKPSWFALPFVLKEGIDRKWVKSYLQSKGVDTRPIVGGNLMRHPAFMFHRALRNESWSLPGADTIHDRGFYVGLPLDKNKTAGLIGILEGALA